MVSRIWVWMWPRRFKKTRIGGLYLTQRTCRIWRIFSLMWARSTRYHIEKLGRLQFRPGENQLHVACSQSLVCCFTHDLAKICGDCQIAVLIQLLGRHARPFAVDFATLNGAA